MTTDFLSVRLDSEIKKQLKQKAASINLTLTQFIEKIANEPIVFLDDNVKRLLGAIQCVTPAIQSTNTLGDLD
jgi:predicted DNA-binding ribbon-helix-helix protein